jgi:hypothetical protein
MPKKNLYKLSIGTCHLCFKSYRLLMRHVELKGKNRARPLLKCSSRINEKL